MSNDLCPASEFAGRARFADIFRRRGFHPFKPYRATLTFQCLTVYAANVRTRSEGLETLRGIWEFHNHHGCPS